MLKFLSIASLLCFISPAVFALEQGASVQAMQTNEIKNDSRFSSVKNQLDALLSELERVNTSVTNLNADLTTLKNKITNCSLTNGTFSPSTDQCRDMELQEVERKVKLSSQRCTAINCTNQAAFDISEYINPMTSSLHAYMRWGGCGATPGEEYYIDIDLDNPSTQTKTLLTQQTRSGSHGQTITAVYHPSSKKLEFNYTLWGDGMWCSSKGDGWNRHYMNERGIQVITPEIVGVERPL